MPTYYVCQYILDDKILSNYAFVVSSRLDGDFMDTDTGEIITSYGLFFDPQSFTVYSEAIARANHINDYNGATLGISYAI